MCCQLEEEDDLEFEVENMKKAFTVSDTMVSAVSSSDLQLDSLQRLQHQRSAESNGHRREMMSLSLQRTSYEAEEDKVMREDKGKVMREEKEVSYQYDAAKRMEAEKRHERAKRNERLNGRGRSEDCSDSVKKRRSQSYSKHVDGRRSMDVSSR